jgi:hypothetical protein
LPLLLILAGVIGGLMAFGLIGIFLGPTILAVGYKLLGAWIAEAEMPETAYGEALPETPALREPETAQPASLRELPLGRAKRPAQPLA